MTGSYQHFMLQHHCCPPIPARRCYACKLNETSEPCEHGRKYIASAETDCEHFTTVKPEYIRVTF